MWADLASGPAHDVAYLEYSKSDRDLDVHFQEQSINIPTLINMWLCTQSAPSHISIRALYLGLLTGSRNCLESSRDESITRPRLWRIL